MGEIIFKNAIQREKGYLYYIDKEGNIGRAKLSRDGRPKKKKEIIMDDEEREFSEFINQLEN